jgi:hypothetical protein
MIIYYCHIAVYTRDGYETEPWDVSASEIFTTLDEAKDWGLEEINKGVQELVDKIIPADYEKEEVDEWINEWRINFWVEEFDPFRKKEIDDMTKSIEESRDRNKRYDGDMYYDALYKNWYYHIGEPSSPYLRNNPYKFEWHFDRHGNLVDRYFWPNERFVYKHLPGDDEPLAGTKFKVGDYVMCSAEGCDPERIYVVCSAPPAERTMRWTNTYVIIGIKNDEILVDYGSGMDVGRHETELRLYDGEISEDDPLYFLHLVETGKIELTSEEMQDLEDGKIALNKSPSWREVIPNIGGAK